MEAEDIASQFASRFGKEIVIGRMIHELKHAVTRYRITLKSYEAELDSSVTGKWNSAVETNWASPNELSNLALSSSGKKLWACVQAS